MLTRLRIEDFQSWDSADVELGPFTVFVGPSSRGKSAIVRALEALATNPPVPKSTQQSYIRHGKKECLVLVEDSDGTVVSWVKGPQPLYYTLVNGDEHEFTKLGREVPNEVRDALGIRPISVDDQHSIWPQFHTQGLDYAWLIRESPSQRARTLAAMTRLDAIVGAQILARRDIKRSNDAISTTTAQLAGVEQELADYEDLAVDEKRLKRARALSDTIDEQQARFDQGSTLQVRRERYEEQLREDLPETKVADKLLRQAQHIARAHGLVLQRREVLSRVKSLSDAVVEATEDLAAAEQELTRVRKLIQVCQVCGRSK